MIKGYELPPNKMARFLERLSEIEAEATDKTIRPADEYGVSRDDTMEQFSWGMSLVTSNVSFEDYEIEEEANENRG